MLLGLLVTFLKFGRFVFHVLSVCCLLLGKPLENLDVIRINMRIALVHLSLGGRLVLNSLLEMLLQALDFLELRRVAGGNPFHLIVELLLGHRWDHRDVLRPLEDGLH